MATVGEALAETGLAIGRRDAELLLSARLGCERVWLLAHPEASLSTAVLSGFHSLVHRRVGGEPLQYILGKQEFFGLPLQVGPGVLIPRPETEGLVEAVLAWVRDRELEDGEIVDVGTGSGAIALALASRLPEAQITAVDRSPVALRWAEENARMVGFGDRVRWMESDLLAGLDGERFQVVVSNPPYIPERDRDTLQREVRDYEPEMALYGGPDGLALYRRLIPEASKRLYPGGLLAMEFGFGQRDALAELLPGWSDVRFVEDLAGIPRVVLAQRPWPKHNEGVWWHPANFRDDPVTMAMRTVNRRRRRDQGE